MAFRTIQGTGKRMRGVGVGAGFPPLDEGVFFGFLLTSVSWSLKDKVIYSPCKANESFCKMKPEESTEKDEGHLSLTLYLPCGITRSTF